MRASVIGGCIIRRLDWIRSRHLFEGEQSAAANRVRSGCVAERETVKPRAAIGFARGRD